MAPPSLGPFRSTRSHGSTLASLHDLHGSSALPGGHESEKAYTGRYLSHAFQVSAQHEPFLLSASQYEEAIQAFYYGK